MKRLYVILGIGSISLAMLALQACSGDNNSGSDAGDASNTNDVQTKDAPNDVVPSKDGGSDASDASDGAPACSAAWTAAPDASMLVPDGGLPPTVLLHAFGTGTQNYECVVVDDAGTYGWVLTTPAANLEDCNQAVIGHHFASDAGPLATRPEWQTNDGNYVIAKKVLAYDAGSASIPWLLLQETSNSGADSGIAQTLYVQRLNTTGGWPTATCDSNNNADGGTTTAAYTADYYFYGN